MDWSLSFRRDSAKGFTVVLNNAITHKPSKVKDKTKKCETSFSIMPSGLTWRLQPLENIIHKMFKGSLKHNYVCYWIERKKNYQRVQS